MRLMETIRRKGHYFLIVFLAFFVISLFFGLTTGNINPFQKAENGAAAQSNADVAKAPSLSSDKSLTDVALTVDGRKVTNNVLDQMEKLIEQNYGMSNNQDPMMKLQAYGFAMSMVANQEALMEYGEKNGIKLDDADWQKARDAATMGQVKSADDKKSGNLLGDALGKLSDAKAKKAAFEQYLEMQGLNEQEWQEDTQRSIYSTKVRDAITDEEKTKKKTAAEAKEKDIDKALAGGQDFGAVAKKYSEGPQKDTSGEVGWIGRGLLEKDVSDKLFATPAGKDSEWIETPAWLKKFHVYEKKEAKGADFDKAKPNLVKQIRDQRKDQKYEPSPEELANAYEQVKVKVIDLSLASDQEAGKRMQDLNDAAHIEVYNPYLLAYQALKDYKLQPPANMGKDQLITIAKLAPVAENYDYSDIDKKLAAGSKAASSAADKKPAADAKGPKAAADSKLPEARDTTPIYALAAGLLQKARQDKNAEQGDSWPYFVEARVYLDWIKDEQNLAKQPLDTKKARANIEELLAQVVKGDNYNASAHAQRGLNLARLDKKQEAEAELALAEKYAGGDDQETWQSIKEGYEVADDSAKLAEVNKKLSDIQQKQFQEMIQRQLQQQQAGGGGASQSIPIKIGGK